MRQGKRSGFYDKLAWETFDGGQDYAQAVRVMNVAGGLLHVGLDAVLDEAYDMLERPEVWTGVEAVAKDLMRF
jgi:hypothetical protein